MYSLDSSSFILNLKTRRDRGFHVHKELCQYLYKLAQRCIRPSCLPSEADYHDILRISIPDAKALTVTDFISRLKLGPRLEACCKRKSEKERKEAKHSELSLEEIIANTREEFGRQARWYVAHLFGAATGLTRFTSDIVKGLGSFDLETLFVDTMEQAAYCFKNLFSSFRLRGVFQSEEETVYIEEYLSFIDELRRTHPEMQQPKLLFADTIDFVSKQPALKSRVHLTRIFRLSCLCIDEPRFMLTPVRFIHLSPKVLLPVFWPWKRHLGVLGSAVPIVLGTKWIDSIALQFKTALILNLLSSAKSPCVLVLILSVLGNRQKSPGTTRLASVRADQHREEVQSSEAVNRVGVPLSSKCLIHTCR